MFITRCTCTSRKGLCRDLSTQFVEVWSDVVLMRWRRILSYGQALLRQAFTTNWITVWAKKVYEILWAYMCRIVQALSTFSIALSCRLLAGLLQKLHAGPQAICPSPGPKHLSFLTACLVQLSFGLPAWIVCISTAGELLRLDFLTWPAA